MVLTLRAAVAAFGGADRRNAGRTATRKKAGQFLNIADLVNVVHMPFRAIETPHLYR